MTIECHSPTGFDTFRLEKEGTGSHSDMKNPLHETVARFPIPADEDIAGHYHCIYLKGSWSERSELLELRVTGEDASLPPQVCLGVRDGQTRPSEGCAGCRGHGPGPRQPPRMLRLLPCPWAQEAPERSAPSPQLVSRPPPPGGASGAPCAGGLSPGPSLCPGPGLGSGNAAVGGCRPEALGACHRAQADGTDPGGSYGGHSPGGWGSSDPLSPSFLC